MSRFGVFNNESRSLDGRKQNNRSSSSFSRATQKKVVINDHNFPSLSVNSTINSEPAPPRESASWQATVKEQSMKDEEKNSSCIDEMDSKYWCGVRWIGPMMLRQKPSSVARIDISSNHLPLSPISSILVPNKGVEYSRDDVTWYNSWDDTFSEEQLYNIHLEKESEYQEGCARRLDDYREASIKESRLYYEETCELDGFAIAELDRLAYDEYAKQFDIDVSSNDNLENDEDDENIGDYLEDDY
jgi:hypothetical protein|tara:strand:+ start:2646 stop:3377 length:732 start_codon:yes stop_codon:yes gene_type:complete